MCAAVCAASRAGWVKAALCGGPAHHRKQHAPHVTRTQQHAVQLKLVDASPPCLPLDQTNFFFGGVDNLRWRKPVVPGDVLVRPATCTGGG